MRRFTDLLKRFRRDERGAFAVIFALLAIVLIATSGAVVDFTYTQTARSRAQTALDSAALALQARISTDDNATLKSKAQSILRERLNDTAITATVNTATVDTATGKLAFQASITVPTAFVQLVGIPSITAQLTSEVTRGSKDLEVSVALDTTGSMAGSKIDDLISATKTLIGLVINDVQTPTYSKMAIIPWSAGVNMKLPTSPAVYASGYSIDSVRGTPIPATTITGATWMKTTTRNISSFTKANPGVITTSSSHGLVTGDYVWVSGVNGVANGSGTRQIPDGIYKVNRLSNTTLQLQKWNGSSWVTFNSSSYTAYSTTTLGKITGCFTANCEVVVTSANHGLAAGDNVYITGVGGMTQLNNSMGTNVSTVDPVGAVLTTSTFSVTNVKAATIGYGSTYSGSGGTAQCVKYGCKYYYFSSYTLNRWGNPAAPDWGSPSSGHTIYQAGSCVTERTGSHQADDVAPSTAFVGINYTENGASCITQTLLPLTSDKNALTTLAGNLSAGGSTAGHLGLAWGWYMLSPNFGYLWPSASRPGAYGQNNLVKAVILMTDGLFNVQYCSGVITPEDPANGHPPAGTTTYNDCAPDNGYSKAQAQALCDAIKAPDNHITLYTVGFDLGSDADSLAFLQGCASDPSDFFRADTGTDLTNAFKKIAQGLNSLRISH